MSDTLDIIYTYLQDPDLWQGSASELDSLEHADARVSGILSGLFVGTGGSVDYRGSYENSNTVENALYYELEDNLYQDWKLIEGLVYSSDTVYTIGGVDLWISDGYNWYDIVDPAIAYEDDYYASFRDYWLNVSDYDFPTGSYSMWGRGYDLSGQYIGNDHYAEFTVEAAPKYLSLDITGDYASGWVFHADGSDDLYYMDIYLQPTGGEWQYLGYIDSFEAWSEDSRWGSFGFQLDMSGYQPNTYTLWAEVYDYDYQISPGATDYFEVY